MSLRPDADYPLFISSLRLKFPDLGNSPIVNFKDEDGDMMNIVDDGDFEAAVDVARALGNRLEIWVE